MLSAGAAAHLRVQRLAAMFADVFECVVSFRAGCPTPTAALGASCGNQLVHDIERNKHGYKGEKGVDEEAIDRLTRKPQPMKNHNREKQRTNKTADDGGHADHNVEPNRNETALEWRCLRLARGHGNSRWPGHAIIILFARDLLILVVCCAEPENAAWLQAES